MKYDGENAIKTDVLVFTDRVQGGNATSVVHMLAGDTKCGPPYLLITSTGYAFGVSGAVQAGTLPGRLAQESKEPELVSRELFSAGIILDVTSAAAVVALITTFYEAQGRGPTLRADIDQMSAEILDNQKRRGSEQ